MMNTILEIHGLSKNYGSVRALDQIDLQLESGKIYGLLGRNGAGKTTLLNLITSRIYSPTGQIWLFGQPGLNNQEALARICYMPEKNLFPTGMRVSEILGTAARFYPDFDRGYADSLCRLFQLDPRKKYKNLSRGYESILRVVLGLAARAEITIFDEPILGLDAAIRDLYYQALIQDYSEHPRTFLLSTHLIDESAEIFEDVVILKEGRVVACEPAAALRQRSVALSGRSEAVETFVRDQNLTVLNREGIGHLAILAVRGPLTGEQRSLAQAADLELTPVSLQKLFIYLTESQERQV
ncbi:MAG TPA: ABC transporter ATP-binding protein [Clostridiales bacterium]|nr:ABC transporter ATP-binding protein [Clostridiales bacterium]